MNVDWQLVTLAANFVLASATTLAGAFAYQTSRASAKFVVLGGGVALACSIAEPVILFSRIVQESAGLLSSFASMAGHIAYFGGLALTLLTIAKERRG